MEKKKTIKKDCCGGTCDCSSSANSGFLLDFFKGVMAIMAALALLAVGYAMGVDKSRESGFYSNDQMYYMMGQRAAIDDNMMELK